MDYISVFDGEEHKSGFISNKNSFLLINTVDFLHSELGNRNFIGYHSSSQIIYQS